jgi:selenocysteine lyase/cysteine desulfurase
MSEANAVPRRAFIASLGAMAAVPRSRPGSGGAASPSAASLAATGSLAPAEDFLLEPGLTYLQTASLGPTPRPVMEKTWAAWRALEANPTFLGYGALEGAMDSVRATAAAFLGCAKDELVLTGSTTDGMNWVAEGLTLAPGDRVLTTDQEHPGGRACWDHVARRQGAVLDVVALPRDEHDADAIVDRFTKAVTPRTRVLSFAHVLSSTGLRMPVARLSALARARNCIAVVDGAQAAGGIAVDVKALGCHVYATSGHKWLLGPKGTGLLYLADDLRGRVDPIALQGGRAAYSDSTGFRNLPGMLGLGAALDYVSALGVARIEAHDLALRDALYEGLKRVPKVRVVSAPPGPLASPLLTWELPGGVDSRAFQLRMLEKHRVMLKVVPGQWLNGNRASLHAFNSEGDVERLLAAMGDELG